jgi:hypothetical protein
MVGLPGLVVKSISYIYVVLWVLDVNGYYGDLSSSAIGLDVGPSQCSSAARVRAAIKAPKFSCRQ